MENLKDKIILVTGGTGFIGTAVCAKLAQAGARLFILTRSSHLSSPNIRYISALSEIAGEAPEIIINLAGESIAQRWTPAVKNKIRSSRIETTAALLNFIKSAVKKPSLFISASAIGYYGTDQAIVFDENTPPAARAAFSRQLCADWEAEAYKSNTFGVRTVLLRIGAVFEKEGGMLARLCMPFKLGLGGPIGHGRQWLSWIDRDDLVSLILHVIHTPSLDGPVNATAPEPVTNQTFSKTFADVLRRPCLLPVPALALRMIFGDMAEELMLEGQKVLPKKALDSGFSFAFPTLRSSLQKIYGVDQAR